MPAKRWDKPPRNRVAGRGKRAVTPQLKGRRANAYGLRITFDIADLEEFAKRLTRQSELARPALVEAHKDLASALQASVSEALEDKIAERGRVQRDGELLKAIQAKSAVVATTTGFTFGFLESAKGAVRLYARNLEEGSPVHIGQPFNAFRNEAGELVPPIKGDRKLQIDPKLIAFRDLGQRRAAQGYEAPAGSSDDSRSRYTRVRNSKQKIGRGEDRSYPVFFIKHPIPPYKYFAAGMKNFRSGNILGVSNFQDMILGLYEGYFADAGMNFYLRWFLHYHTIEPGAGQAALRRQIGRKSRASDAAWI